MEFRLRCMKYLRCMLDTMQWLHILHYILMESIFRKIKKCMDSLANELVMFICLVSACV